MQNQVLYKIAKSLKNAKSIVILPHVCIDGDALGASVALALALKNLEKNADVLIEEEIPSNLDFLPGLEMVGHNSDKVYDVAVNIDNGDITRLGNREAYYHNAGLRISIDHHSTNHVKADYSYVDTKAAATGEIIYDLIQNYLSGSINKDIAMCLYTAITTDTGCFRYSNTTPRTLEICADLIRQDIDFSFAIKKLFDMTSYTKLCLMKQTMNSLRLMEDGKFAVAYLSYDDIQRYKSKTDDFEGLVNIGRNLEGVEVSLFLREEEKGKFRGSLRSNDYVDASLIAEKFNGGGHIRAAGFTVEGDIEKIIDDAAKVIIPAIRGKS
jgi:phosphoesterase RecJ-like protein